ncbi:TPA: hypothetical protein DEP34_02125 [Candidatus Uhrbacteria bacterium]|nr:hypothetical protein [Candidatus Uhrbacteria bacterium]HCB19159.1 hypothetical protein [Candidatus Uhrbacteria bacterium]
MKSGFVYILASCPFGTLYIGVTSNLPKRIWEHKEGVVKGFTKKYGIRHLVYYEIHSTITGALQRERQLKRWKRTWKINLIMNMNPQWKDLYEEL